MAKWQVFGEHATVTYDLVGRCHDIVMLADEKVELHQVELELAGPEEANRLEVLRAIEVEAAPQLVVDFHGDYILVLLRGYEPIGGDIPIFSLWLEDEA